MPGQTGTSLTVGAGGVTSRLPTVVTPPSEAFSTTARVAAFKTFSRSVIAIPDPDAVRLLEAAVAEVEGVTGRAVVREERELLWTDAPEYPTQLGESYYNTPEAAYLVSGAWHTVEADGGAPAGGLLWIRWPAADAYRVHYQAGWADPPAAVEQIIYALAAARWEKRDQAAEVQRRLLTERWTIRPPEPGLVVAELF